MENNVSTPEEQGEKIIYTGRGSYLKNHPEMASINGKKGDNSKKIGRPRTKVLKVIDKSMQKKLMEIVWTDKDKIEENTLTLLGDLLTAAKGDFDRLLNVAKEIIKLIPKKEGSNIPRIINMNFLGNMQTKPDEIDLIKVEDAEYKVVGMSKEKIENLLLNAENIVEGAIDATS